MTEIGLYRPRVVPGVGQGVAAGMAQHTLANFVRIFALCNAPSQGANREISL
jgi:hypothetical protein